MGDLSSITNNGTIIGGNSPNGAGIYLQQGGLIANLTVPSQASALINGATAINVASAAGTVNNSGTITGKYDAVALQMGGTVSNAASGLVTASLGSSYAIKMSVSTGTVINNGTIGAGRYGIDLGGGGFVSNGSTGLITSASVGFSGDPGTLQNDGTIDSEVSVVSGGSISNAAGGVIKNNTAVSDGSGAYSFTLVNAGSIETFGPKLGIGVVLSNGAGITNAAGAMISWAIGIAGTEGADAVLLAPSITNAGIISGYTDGINLASGGSITNQSGATIASGQFGIDVTGGRGVVENDGSIIATPHPASVPYYAIRFAPGYANLLRIAPGAFFAGTVNGGNTLGGAVASTLELASAAGGGTLSHLGFACRNFAQIAIDSGAN